VLVFVAAFLLCVLGVVLWGGGGGGGSGGADEN